MYISEIIKNRINELGITWYRLWKITGIGWGTFERLKENPNNRVSSINLIKIANALEIDLNEFKKIDGSEINDSRNSN
ncbi:helix-turn-helix transcriptional regulator [Weissella diestrammenae]|uniref:Helix-turn-helix transcriptional regulator n=1 Tax=Weissella diestrammenae TaxID=1162633 RepID=A0A7G9T4G6_9LACO|nr:helix-turn-helix transcriptional regulator [Weissella diestrammenae]QNN74991.1 helix-turn-helix transcriptional regulator [Weissella diestrammenae]